MHLIEEQGRTSIDRFWEFYPELDITQYELSALQLERELAGADLVLAHEWNDPELIWKLGIYRRSHRQMRLLFHDTHHRAVSNPQAMAAYDLSEYDGVLDFGSVIRALYLQRRWCRHAWTWHEAADTTVFQPKTAERLDGELAWIGNWGDGERTEELHRYLLKPVAELGLSAQVHGVRDPHSARQALAKRGIRHAGWLPNYDVPTVFSRFRVTIHVPRRQCARSLPGIPTIRPFETLACGIPLVSAPWENREHLFTPGQDYLVARNSREMSSQLRNLLEDPGTANSIAAHGQRTIQDRHTCAHRANELLRICEDLELPLNMQLSSLAS